MYIHSQKKTFGLKVILPKYKSYKTKLKNQFPFGTSRVTLDTLALVQRFHYRFLSFYLFLKGSLHSVSRGLLVFVFFTTLLMLVVSFALLGISSRSHRQSLKLNPIHKRWCIIILNFLFKKNPENRADQNQVAKNGSRFKMKLALIFFYPRCQKSAFKNGLNA